MIKIHPTAILYPNVKVENNVEIGPYCIIGAPPEDKKCGNGGHGVLIKSGTVIHGHATIDSGTQGKTVIGENCYLMKGVHIGHDAQIGNFVTMSPHVCIGGFVRVQDGVNFGMSSVVHNRQIIGAYCMIGANSFVTKSAFVKPGLTFVGSPAKCIGTNEVGLMRAGIDDDILAKYEKEYDQIKYK